MSSKSCLLRSCRGLLPARFPLSPTACTGEIIEHPESVWWVQMRNSRAQVGWTNEPDKFYGSYAFDPDYHPNLKGTFCGGSRFRHATNCGTVAHPSRRCRAQLGRLFDYLLGNAKAEIAEDTR